MSAHTTLTLEQVATLRASLDLSPHPDEVLARAGLPRDVFAAEESRWLELLADELDRGEATSLAAFQAAYEAARTASGARSAPEGADAARAPSAAQAEPLASSALAAPPMAPHPPAPPIVPAPPSSFATDETVVPAPRLSKRMSGTLNVDASALSTGAPAPALPFATGQASAPPAPAPQADHESTGTADLDMSAFRTPNAKGELPFSGAPAPAAPAAAVQLAPLPTSAQIDAFLRSGAAPSPAAPAAPSPAAPALPKQTAFVDVHAVAAGARLPFQPGAASPPPPAVRSAPPSSPHAQPAPRVMPASVAVRETVALPDGIPGLHTLPPNKDAGRGPATPFGPAASASPEAVMPLERFVEITVALERDGKPLETFQRFGIDPPRWMSVLHAYNARFPQDPGLKARFDALLDSLRKNKK
jgi:hypothetical protein